MPAAFEADAKVLKAAVCGRITREYGLELKLRMMLGIARCDSDAAWKDRTGDNLQYVNSKHAQ